MHAYRFHKNKGNISLRNFEDTCYLTRAKKGLWRSLLDNPNDDVTL